MEQNIWEFFRPPKKDNPSNVNPICPVNREERTPDLWRESLPVSAITQVMMILGDQLFHRIESQHRAQSWHENWQDIIKL